MHGPPNTIRLMQLCQSQSCGSCKLLQYLLFYNNLYNYKLYMLNKYLVIKYDNQEYRYPLIVKEDIEPLSVKELIGKYLKDILF